MAQPDNRRSSRPAGVSIVVCCHNSALRLPQTLAHLAGQRVPPGLRWEVIVVDNGSTDGTSRVAAELWPADAPAPLRVVCEPRLGLSHARRRGFAEAAHEVVSFVDDDNWVCPEWVSLVSELMTLDPTVGVCGGFIDPVCEAGRPPDWFEQCYPETPRERLAGDITSSPGWVPGGGMSIRKSAWQQLVSGGFSNLLPDRRGAELSSGGDVELCFALRLAGWRLWYDPRLRLRHFIPARRIEWGYLRRLSRGFGTQLPVLNVYLHVTNRRGGLAGRLRSVWGCQALKALAGLLRHPLTLVLSLRYPLVGDLRLLDVEVQVGWLLELLRVRKSYRMLFNKIQHARWNSSSSPPVKYVPSTVRADS